VKIFFFRSRRPLSGASLRSKDPPFFFFFPPRCGVDDTRGPFFFSSRAPMPIYFFVGRPARTIYFPPFFFFFFFFFPLRSEELVFSLGQRSSPIPLAGLDWIETPSSSCFDRRTQGFFEPSSTETPGPLQLSSRRWSPFCSFPSLPTRAR